MEVKDIYTGDDPETVKMAELIIEQAEIETKAGDAVTNKEILQLHGIPEKVHIAVSLAVQDVKLVTDEGVLRASESSDPVMQVNKIQESGILAAFLLGYKYAQKTKED